MHCLLLITLGLAWSPQTPLPSRRLLPSRRQVLGAGLAPLLTPVAAGAAALSRAAALASLSAAEAKLGACALLVGGTGATASTVGPTQLREAASILGTRELDAASLSALFEAVTEKPSATEQAMNNAAFVVYYEEARYGDMRLEPQTPGLRAQQNGFKLDVLRNVEDLRAEINFLVGGAQPGDVEDFDDLRKYSRTASEALRQFIELSKLK